MNEGWYYKGPYGVYGSLKGRATVEECVTLDINDIKKRGSLEAGNHMLGQWRNGYTIKIHVVDQDTIRLHYTAIIGDESKVIKDDVRLEYKVWDHLKYVKEGKARVFMHCPGCSKRVSKLYLHRVTFRCRSCHNLTYRSVQARRHEQRGEDATGQYMDRCNMILERMGVKPVDGYDLSCYTPPKPKNMWNKTYSRLLKEFRREQKNYNNAFNAFAGSFMERFM